jgi:hypothetical protein
LDLPATADGYSYIMKNTMEKFLDY